MCVANVVEASDLKVKIKRDIAAWKDTQIGFVTKRKEEVDLEHKGLGEVGIMEWASKELAELK